jgi:hypothetical protein
MIRRVILGTAAVGLLLAPVVLAGTQSESRLALHYSGTCDKCIPDVCGIYSPTTLGTPCSEYVTTWSYQQFPHDSLRGEPWPATGSGNRIRWNPDTDCRRETVGDEGVHAVLGAFYLYEWTPGDHFFAVTVDSTLLDIGILVTDCKGDESLLATPGGSVGSQTPGFNPCFAPAPVRATTWGRIKATY